MQIVQSLPVLRTNSVKLDTQKFTSFVDNHEVQLTKSEFLLLYLLARRPSRVYSDLEILYFIHGEEVIRSRSTVKVLICSLRTKLGKSAKHIQTVYGVGVKYEE